MAEPETERPEAFPTLTDRLRWQFRNASLAVGRGLGRLGIHPNTLTILGLLVVGYAGVMAAQGRFVAAGITYLIAVPFDGLDGAVARATGKTSTFGALLDSSLDRYGESALLAGLGYWLAGEGRGVELLLVFATLTGSFMVSYVRGRAGGLGHDIKIGLMTRVERYVAMLVILFTGQLFIGLLAMAILTNFTFLQRMVKAYQLMREE